MTTSIAADDLQAFVGQDLSAVKFGRDSIELQFNWLALKAYTPVSVRCGSHSAILGDAAFADLIIGQIDKYARAIEHRPAEAVRITFEDGSTIEMSVRPEDRRPFGAIKVAHDRGIEAWL